MWYYTENEQPFGPFEAAELQERVANGTLPPTTFVWREGLPNWVPLDEVEELRGLPEPVSVASVATPISMHEHDPSPYAPRTPVVEPVSPNHSHVVSAAEIHAQLGQDVIVSDTPLNRIDTSSFPNYVCCECGRTFSVNMMVFLEGRWVCATCKPVYVQKLEERYYDRAGLTYAAFSTRFHSGFYDYLVLQMLTGASAMFLVFPLAAISAFPESSLHAALTIAVVIGGVSFVLFLRFIYEAYWVSQKGSTPGQTKWGLIVVKTDGSRLTTKQALIRSLANLLTYVSFGMGYCIALFDDEKRSLTDIMCGTRVIYIRK